MSGFKIQNLHAIVCTEKDGTEGVMAFHDGNGWMPMVAADEVRLKLILPLAQGMAKAHGIEFRVVKFDNRVDVTEEAIEKYGKKG